MQISHPQRTIHHPRGFTTLFAILIAALLLSVGLAIFEITIKQVIFSTIVRDSNEAIYAADTGAECALYWDFECSLGACQIAADSAFATSSDSNPPTQSVVCNDVDVTTGNLADTGNPAGYGAWDIVSGTNAATTTFTFPFPAFSGTNVAAEPSCVTVSVAKWGNPSKTRITSSGHNTCNTGDTRRIERTLEVNY